MGTEGRKMGGAKRSSGKGREGRGESRGSRACQVGSLEGLAGERGLAQVGEKQPQCWEVLFLP